MGEAWLVSCASPTLLAASYLVAGTRPLNLPDTSYIWRALSSLRHDTCAIISRARQAARSMES